MAAHEVLQAAVAFLWLAFVLSAVIHFDKVSRKSAHVHTAARETATVASGQSCLNVLTTLADVENSMEVPNVQFDIRPETPNLRSLVSAILAAVGTGNNPGVITDLLKPLLTVRASATVAGGEATIHGITMPREFEAARSVRCVEVKVPMDGLPFQQLLARLNYLKFGLL